jgi:probable metal-binding protein
MITHLRPIMGHDVLSLVAEAGGRCSTEALRAAAAARFGSDAVYGNCHGQLFSFDQLLEFFAMKGKLAREGDEVALGRVPACSGH